MYLSAYIHAQTTQSFNYTGANQSFTIPSGVCSVTVQAWGGGGGGGGTDTQAGNAGGGGAYASSVIAVTPGQVLTIVVGGGGAGGYGCLGSAPGGGGGFGLGTGGAGGNAGPSGCSGAGGGGGGGTGILNGASPMIVAAGGGGGGGGGNFSKAGTGGGGGVAGNSNNAATAGSLSGGSGNNGGVGTCIANDGGGGGGGGGGLAGGGGGSSLTSDDGGAGGAGGTSLGTTIANGAGQTSGNSGTLGGLCATCSSGGSGTGIQPAYGSAGGNGFLQISYPTPVPNLGAGITSTILCGAATATVNVTGGAAPYAYSWSTMPVQVTPTATILVSGTYTATIKDANTCTISVSAVINIPPALTLTAVHNNVSCNGLSNGSATATATGGVAPYTYGWNTSPPQISTTGIATGLAAGSYTAGVQDANGCRDTVSITITQPAILATTIGSFKNDSCFGNSNGSANSNTTGGTIPYSYSWNSSPIQTTANATNLPAGSYTLVVTDANACSATTTVTITQPSAFSVSIASFKNDSCFGTHNGNAVSAIVGGTAPYTYSWNTTPTQTTANANNLPFGVYTLTATDIKGCVSTVSVSISQPPALTLTATQSSVTCNGLSNGSATATATGGVAPYLYGWSTSPPQISATGIATGMAAGVYTAGVQDANGCQMAFVLTITQPSVLKDSITSFKNDSCYGNSNGLAVSGTKGGISPYTYAWSTSPAQTTANATNLPAGTYTLVVTDANSCTATTTVAITQPSVFSVSITSFKNDSCFGTHNGNAVSAIVGGTAPYTYAWTTTPVQTTTTAINLSFGTYTVLATDAKGCTTTASVSISQPPALTLTVSQTNVSCNGMSNGSGTATAVGGTGPYMYAWSTAPPQISVTGIATGMAAGVYTAGVQDANGCQDTLSVTITQPTVLVATITNTINASCFGFSTGSTTATATGGTAPYHYAWSNGQNNNQDTALIAGTYTCIVSDAQ
ncbi:MAG: SprB repeat-containing protein, partial [Bacteroidetes bacterium]|nr:SprB repeat-containing protein [Bacteroidota bacterium]